MARAHHYRRRQKEEAPELDMTTFLNLMVVLVPFLLITAVFSRITIVELDHPIVETQLAGLRRQSLLVGAGEDRLQAERHRLSRDQPPRDSLCPEAPIAPTTGAGPRPATMLDPRRVWRHKTPR